MNELIDQLRREFWDWYIHAHEVNLNSKFFFLVLSSIIWFPVDKKGFHKNVHHRLIFSKALIYNRIYWNFVDSPSRKPREEVERKDRASSRSSRRGENVLSFSFAFPLRKPATLAKAWFERFFFLLHNLCLKLTVLLNRTSDDVTRSSSIIVAPQRCMAPVMCLILKELVSMG